MSFDVKSAKRAGKVSCEESVRGIDQRVIHVSRHLLGEVTSGAEHDDGQHAVGSVLRDAHSLLLAAGSGRLNLRHVVCVTRIFFLAQKKLRLRLDVTGARSEASTTRVRLAEFLDLGAQLLLVHIAQALRKDVDVELAKRLTGGREE